MHFVDWLAVSVGMGPKHAPHALPTHKQQATAGAYPAAAGAYPNQAAPRKQRRGWFGRNKTGAAASTGAAAAAPGETYTAQPFNQPTSGYNRDVEMGDAPARGSSARCLAPLIPLV